MVLLLLLFVRTKSIAFVLRERQTEMKGLFARRGHSHAMLSLTCVTVCVLFDGFSINSILFIRHFFQCTKRTKTTSAYE